MIVHAPVSFTTYSFKCESGTVASALGRYDFFTAEQTVTPGPEDPAIFPLVSLPVGLIREPFSVSL